MLVKIYKHETITSVAEIEAPSEEQALRFVRASVGMPNGPAFTELSRSNARVSLRETTEKQAKKVPAKSDNA
jgi:hypothetical protein